MLSSRKLDQLEAAAAAIGGDTAVYAANAGDLDAAEACVAATIERFGRLDILVNNAATNPHFGATLDVEPGRVRQDVRRQPARPAVLVAGGVPAGVRATSPG